jgi:hypothetical protein
MEKKAKRKSLETASDRTNRRGVASWECNLLEYSNLGMGLLTHHDNAVIPKLNALSLKDVFYSQNVMFTM